MPRGARISSGKNQTPPRDGERRVVDVRLAGVYAADGVHGAGDVKKSLDVAVAEKLLKTIDEIADIFWQTEKAKGMGVYPPA